MSITLSSVKRLYAQEGHYFDIACLPNQDCLDESKLRSFMYTGLGERNFSGLSHILLLHTLKSQ